jgi:hypothetical protein
MKVGDKVHFQSKTDRTPKAFDGTATIEEVFPNSCWRLIRLEDGGRLIYASDDELISIRQFRTSSLSCGPGGFC